MKVYMIEIVAWNYEQTEWFFHKTFLDKEKAKKELKKLKELEDKIEEALENNNKEYKSLIKKRSFDCYAGGSVEIILHDLEVSE